MALVLNRATDRQGRGATVAPMAAAAVSRRVAGVPWYRQPDAVAPGIATVMVVVGYAVSIAIWGALREAPIRVTSDVGIFGLLYIAAQATERLLEPFAAFVLRSESAKDEVEVSLAAAMNSPDDPTVLQAAAEARERLEQRQRARAYVLWAAATVVGMLASATIGLYLIAAIAVDRGPVVPVDILVTGLVIGGGTKPLHDLISRIESAKQNAEAPAER
jgi:hypothetical protein